MKGGIFTCRWSADLPEAAASVEGLDGEQAAAVVPDDQEPPTFDAARVRKLRPPAPQERAVAVPPHLDGPDLLAGAGRADDVGLPGADFLGELVRDALQRGETSQFPRPEAPAAERAARRRGRSGSYQAVAGERKQHP